MRALLCLRDGPNYRREAFARGLAAAGFDVVERLDRPTPADIVVAWNRTGAGAEMALHVEQHGGRAVIVENGWAGKAWRGGKWFTATIGQCGGAGTWPDGGASRWDDWNVALAPWQREGSETLILAQRGIGAPGLASPPGWAEKVQARIGGRIRRHPGANSPEVPLQQDLADARCVVTWHSAGAMQALLLGVPVFYDCPSWIGAQAGRPLSKWELTPKRDDADRLAMFRRAAWALWEVTEVESGQAFRHLLAR